MGTSTLFSFQELENTEIRVTFDDEGRPVTHLSTQTSLDAQMQELFRVHVYAWRRQLDGMTQTHKFHIQDIHPERPSRHGSYLVVTTTYHP